jgi:hypothetical protein
MRVLGQMTSMAVITIVFAALLGDGQITRERYDSFISAARICFSISSLLCFTGVFFSWFRGSLHTLKNETVSGKGEADEQ